MCGLAGFIDAGHALPGDRLEAVAREMADRMVPRGPDDAGSWADPGTGVAFGFRRLSILDLSDDGHQPMSSPAGRWVVTFNGEIYNHESLRADLEAAGVSGWRGHSDTEVLVAAIETWGFAPTLERLNGMFAIAAWDREARDLWLARDRFGEKPLYYGEAGGVLLFGSELKALAAHPAWSGELDWSALASFMRFSYVPGPHTAYAGIRKLPPGSFLRIAHGTAPGTPERYWSVEETALHAAAHPFAGGYEEAVDELERLMLDAVNMRTRADVPVGAFLSGGIDSSTVCAAMQAGGKGTPNTFSIAFEDARYNEAPFAEAVAAHLGTDHTTMDVSEQDCLDVLPRLPEVYDEPFADASQIPTMVLCARARENVTVALAGDGGDELFLGYPRHLEAAAVWERAGRMPAAGRALLRGLGHAVGGRPGTVVRKIQRYVGNRGAATAEQVYANYVSWWAVSDDVVRGVDGHPTVFERPGGISDIRPYSRRFSLLDAASYLPDDLLVKVDRASMAASLEVRAPFLDHRVAAFAWSLPQEMLVDGWGGKRVLRDVLDRHVPRELIDRPKQGFEAPIERWLRDGLRDWAEGLLSEQKLSRTGMLNVPLIRARWDEHARGRRNWCYHLWNVLMLQAWLERR
ncbi:MAG: asparagine synthase (glutamine-hydrolyzing) [Alphaproteobacteria bacterium]|nr:asparagine synthase (glutamine-hydrolyzing) [Alphaproteobacteria bacterium]